MKKNNSNRNAKIVLMIASLVVLTITISYAFFLKYGTSLKGNISSGMNLATGDYLFYTSGMSNISINGDSFLNDDHTISDTGTIQVEMSSLDENKLLSCNFDIYYVWDSNDKYITPDITLNDEFPFEYSLTLYNDNDLLSSEVDLSTLYNGDYTSGGVKVFEGINLQASKLEQVYSLNVVNKIYDLPVLQSNIVGKNFASHLEIRNVDCDNSPCPTSQVCDHYNHEEEVEYYDEYDENIGTTYTFAYTGNKQSFEVPFDGEYKLEVWGAQGGSGRRNGTLQNDGGAGGYATGVITLEKGEMLYIVIGGQGGQAANGETPGSGGYNGGGKGGKDTNVSSESSGSHEPGGGGGGATHISTENELLKNLNSSKSSVLIVAGGGGGGCWGADGCYGSGGGMYGKVPPVSSATVASQTSAGVSSSGTSGGFGYGGTGSSGTDGGGGGGGGWYGGGGGQGVTDNRGGGGGSGYIANENLSKKYMYCYKCTISTDVSTRTYSTDNCKSSDPVADCAKNGHGYAKITYIGHSSTALSLYNSGLLNIGDFVNYDAGTWTQEEIDSIKVGHKEALVYANNSTALPTIMYQFGGFVAGQSRNVGALEYDNTTHMYAKMYDGNNDNNKVPLSGWRVWDIDKTNGKLILISAANPENYHHPIGDTNGAYISEYILTGNKNASWSGNIADYTARDWSMYEDENYGASAKTLTKVDLDNWYKKNVDSDTIDLNNQISIFIKIYSEPFAKYHNLVDNHSFYWLAAPYNANNEYYVDPRFRSVYNYSGYPFGVRVLVSINSSSKINKSAISMRTVTEEGMTYSDGTYGTETRQTYNVWDLQ